MATTKRNITNGMWKFKDMIDVNELVLVAKEWELSPDGFRFGDVIIRRCSKNQIAIWFTYQREDGSEESHNKFFEKFTDQLKRRFGNSYVGWDISSSMTRVK